MKTRIWINQMQIWVKRINETNFITNLIQLYNYHIPYISLIDNTVY